MVFICAKIACTHNISAYIKNKKITFDISTKITFLFSYTFCFIEGWTFMYNSAHNIGYFKCDLQSYGDGPLAPDLI